MQTQTEGEQATPRGAGQGRNPHQ